MWPVMTRPVASRRAPHRRYLPIPDPPERPRTGLYEGEPETCRRDARQFLPIVAHLGLLLAIFLRYRLEGRGFQLLVLTSLVALPVHYLLPFRLKKPFFVAASIAGLAWVFGGAVALVVLPAALALIAIARLPIAWSARAGLLAAAAVGLGFARAGGLGRALPEAVVPMLATMFMFRMVIYMYELKHAERREPLGDALGYFFLLPNYAFPHFPVVDYRTQLRGYFAADIHAIQRRGLRMMVRGTVQLLLYRLVYHRLLITPDDVQGPATLAAFVVCNYLLYLRVSGQFHMACGMLHLFGFQLPETHSNYLLATGFTDYWRRINIYWKDFMVRVVFHPVAFRLRRRPQPLALAAATVAVFATTWALHAYQSFWLRGSWGVSWPDALFWGILGLLVIVNVQSDARNPRRGREAGRSPRALAIRALKTAGTFTTIALLWSLWSSPSVAAWLAMLRRAAG